MMEETAVLVSSVEWMSTGNAIERRRRQNRHTQRAQRQRRRALKDRPAPQKQVEDPTIDSHTKALLSHLSSTHCFSEINILGPKAPASFHLLNLLESAVRTAYAARSPRTDILLGLTQLNVYRALVANISVLGLTASEMHDDALSPFSVAYTCHPRLDELPAPLKPTRIQKEVPHHPWLDLLPDAALRDNMILLDVAGLLDESQCCIDMCSRTDVIVWRDPWDAAGWEVTCEFLAKWRLVLTGCWGWLQSTNYWREKRGEKWIGVEEWVDGGVG